MINIEDNDQLEIPEELPLLPIRDLVVFPDMIAPLFVSRELSIAAVEESLASHRMVLLAAQRDITSEAPLAEDIHKVGTVGIIVRKRRLNDGRMKLLVQGLRKAQLSGFVQEHPYLIARIRPIVDLPLEELSVESAALMRSLREQLQQYSQLSGVVGADVPRLLEGISDPGRLADLVASNLQLSVAEAQEVLETPDPIKRLRVVVKHLARELELASTKSQIERQVHEEMDKNQKEYFLRQQIKHIRTELGEGPDDEISELSAAIAKSDMPDRIRQEAEKQLGRLARMTPESAEAGTIRTYLDWLIGLTWQHATEDQLDLRRAASILDEDHLGLDDVKDRVLEFLSVKKLNPNRPGPLICFVGPPGVGKTSMGRSIARALARRFARISLGGVRDDAEIRGHRRTYVGALPGRIIQAIKQAGSVNPVIVLDEIDKLGRDLRGDPASALLEVLDPEQNCTFVDHYLNLPYDLSRVMFITTANRTDTIPPALLDRLELIELPGYSLEDKIAIAEGFLLPRERSGCGLLDDQLLLSKESLARIVSRYTQEAGLRQFQRALAQICRKAARRVAEKGESPGMLTPEDVVTFLGPTRHHVLEPGTTNSVGIANGLAWTPSGGEVLQIEVNSMPGRGQLILTGHLGQVMQESAQAAVTFARSLHEQIHLQRSYFAEHDLHIHVPAGAIPKDGPSAGAAIGVAVLSVLSGIPVISDVALSGEISLRGRILPVGGLREKIMAAARAGLKQVLIPAGNREEAETLPEETRRQIDIIPVTDMDEVLSLTLTSSPWIDRADRNDILLSSRQPGAGVAVGRPGS